MAHAFTFLALLRKAAPSALMFLVLAFFGGYALLGSNGVMAWGDYSAKLEQRRVELTRLEAEKKQLQNRVALLDPRGANPDMADEMIRRELGLVHPDEVIVPLD